jgi:hypothetical protein
MLLLIFTELGCKMNSIGLAFEDCLSSDPEMSAEVLTNWKSTSRSANSFVRLLNGILNFVIEPFLNAK